MLIFEKNLFYDCTKKELEKISEAIKKDQSNGVLTFGMEAMKVQIERIENISVLREKHLIVYLLTISPKKNCMMKSRNVIFKSDKRRNIQCFVLKNHVRLV